MSSSVRPEVLKDASLHYAPENEQGVVFLFAEWARRRRIRVDRIGTGFPDCIAYAPADGKERRIRIEFEFRSRSFHTHRHDPGKCDWLVCWEDNWPSAPAGLRVIELRREYGLGFNVWIQPVEAWRKDELNSVRRSTWSVAGRAHAGDLILFYLKMPEGCISQVWKLAENAKSRRAGWKPGKDVMASIQRIAVLKSPLFLEDFKRDRYLATAPFVRGSFQGRPNATEYWPELRELILDRNPSLKKVLGSYASPRERR